MKVSHVLHRGVKQTALQNSYIWITDSLVGHWKLGAWACHRIQGSWTLMDIAIGSSTQDPCCHPNATLHCCTYETLHHHTLLDLCCFTHPDTRCCSNTALPCYPALGPPKLLGALWIQLGRSLCRPAVSQGLG